MKHIQVKNFEGSLDLLLELIETKKLDITEISLAEVAEQYLQYFKIFQDRGFGELMEFLDIAAKLILIKSRALLPVLEKEEAEEDIHLLKKKLKIYQFYRRLGKKLKREFQGSSCLLSREAFAGFGQIFYPGENFNLRKMERALWSLEEGFKLKKERKSEAEINVGISVEDAKKKIFRYLEKGGKYKLSSRREKREDLAIYFFTLMELLKDEVVIVSQKELFGELVTMKYKT